MNKTTKDDLPRGIELTSFLTLSGGIHIGFWQMPAGDARSIKTVNCVIMLY